MTKLRIRSASVPVKALSIAIALLALVSCNTASPTNQRETVTPTTVSVGGAMPTESTTEGEGNDGNGPDMRPYAVGTPGIPLYPGAEMISENCIRDCGSACIDYYTTPDEMEQVEAFYKENVPERGWVLLGKSGPADLLIYQNYYYSWKNTYEAGPRRLSLVVGFVQTPQGTTIAHDIAAWPDPSDPPVHPGAKQIEVQWRPAGPIDKTMERVLTYMINIDKKELLDYYNQALLQEGWCRDYYSDSELVYSYGGGGPIKGSAIGVELLPADGNGSSNSIKVQVETRGRELKPEEETQK